VPPSTQPAIQRPHSLILLCLRSYQNGLLTVICGNIPNTVFTQTQTYTNHTHKHTHTHTEKYLTEITGCIVSPVPGKELQTVLNNLPITCKKYLNIDSACQHVRSYVMQTANLYLMSVNGDPILSVGYDLSSIPCTRRPHAPTEHNCPQMNTTVHNCAQLCTTLHHFTQLYTIVYNCAQLYTTLHHFTQLHIIVYNCAQLYTTVHNCAQIFYLIFMDPRIVV
jgi:hypothetical protein